ncbi:hypothetical protein CLV31_10546 [Algoriphagus aquaeductus]|uniref:Carboxypeptidase-like protein n=1 Tax=Algoriphagus aquaeductus TaxID=475299 RepID=A0A326RR01_9BACT|nr:hypothetical protein [Algoriphagus aquaeductus]PZV83823.1 hypothetical protein CLV31_10546 [Algoriphagus aquaeductus]
MKPHLFLVFGLLLCWNAYGQVTYSGNVIDALDKKYLEGVEVSVLGKNKVLTNSRGYFSISAIMGDTLQLSFPGFLERKIVLNEERFMLLELQDRARLLPTFQVKAEPYRFRFKDGKLYLSEDEPEAEKRLSQQVGLGTISSDSPQGVLVIYGPISYFTKRNRQLRQYEEKLEWLRRRAGYLEVIDSDSIRNELMANYRLDRTQWDHTIVRFNEFHQAHEFLDWSKERVLNALREFFRIENYLSD